MKVGVAKGVTGLRLFTVGGAGLKSEGAQVKGQRRGEWEWNRKWKHKLTSTIAVDTIDQLVLTHLIQASVASLAQPIVSTMPPTTNNITFLPLLLPWSSRNNSTDNLVTWDNRPLGASSYKVSLSACKPHLEKAEMKAASRIR